MMRNFILLLLFMLLSFCNISLAAISRNTINELSDKFLDLYPVDDHHKWLIKFYAPWCHHCRQLESTYSEVASQVSAENLDVLVARIDCTRFPSVATHFSIRGFPTIMYISSKRHVEFLGDRSLEDIIDFVRRMSGPAINLLTSCDQINKLAQKHQVAFLYVGQKNTKELTLWSNFSEIAQSLQSSDWFYQIDGPCKKMETESVYSVKSALGIAQKTAWTESSNSKLSEWIRSERFPKYMKFSISNFYQLMHSGKILVITLLRSNPFDQKESRMLEGERRYYERMEKLANSELFATQPNIMFGWTTQMDMINSIALQNIDPLPAFIIIDATTWRYMLLSEPFKMQEMQRLLQQVLMGEMDNQFRGGNNFFWRIYRIAFDSYMSVCAMYSSNPIITSVLFGLPLLLLSFIIYCSCFTDFLDGGEDCDYRDEDEDISDEYEYEQEEVNLDYDKQLYETSGTTKHVKSE